MEPRKNLYGYELHRTITYTLTTCVSISAFVSLVEIPIGSTSSALGLKYCVMTVVIRNYKVII